MLSDTPSTPVRSPAPGVTPDVVTEPVSNGSRVPSDAGVTSAAPVKGVETRGERFRRKALRRRLHAYAIGAVAFVAVLIALAASNTAHVKVNWLVASSRVSLVWLVLAAAILGWALGLMASARFHWRTRAPRRRSQARS
jgi:uncharacterized membrane protein YciS (DUF1049 family)